MRRLLLFDNASATSLTRLTPNRVFASYSDLVDHCCEAWNKLIERPWTIMSIGLRDWANGF